MVPESFSDQDFPMDLVTQIDMKDPGGGTQDEDDDITESDNKNLISRLGLFRNQFSVQLWNMFIGYNPCEDALASDTPRSETSIASLTRLDAWICTVVHLLRDEEKRGGGRQRDYSICFYRFHTKAMYQLIKRVYDFVAFWEPDELAVPDVESDKLMETIVNMPRKATVLLQAHQDNCFYIAVKSDWFNQYITEHMGIVHDCYIAKVSNDWTAISVLEEVLEDDEPHLNPDAVTAGAPSTQQTNSNIPLSHNLGHDALVDVPCIYEEDNDDFPGSDTVPPIPE